VGRLLRAIAPAAPAAAIDPPFPFPAVSPSILGVAHVVLGVGDVLSTAIRAVSMCNSCFTHALAAFTSIIANGRKYRYNAKISQELHASSRYMYCMAFRYISKEDCDKFETPRTWYKILEKQLHLL
jgi:hypothetical protein